MWKLLDWAMHQVSVIAPCFLFQRLHFWGEIDAESLKCFLAVIYDVFYACFSYLLYVMCLCDSDHTLWRDKLRWSFVDVNMLTTPYDGTNWVGLLLMWIYWPHPMMGKIELVFWWCDTCATPYVGTNRVGCIWWLMVYMICYLVLAHIDG